MTALHPKLRALIANPEVVRRELAERSLYHFIRQMWATIEGDAYVDAWHIRVVCEHLEAVVNGEIRRLIINVPPRTMKSLTCNVFFPAWVWAQEPSPDRPHAGPKTRFIHATHRHEMTLRDATKCRAVIDSPLYRARWRDRFGFARDQNAKHRYRNTAAGERLSASVSGKMIGEGGHIVIIDDPHDPEGTESDVQREAVINWWRYTASSRLNDPKTGAFILIMQRLHQNDLCGFLLEHGGWEHLCLPMEFEPDHPHVSIHDIRTETNELLWPEHIPAEQVEEFRQTQGSYGFAGQHQQRPAPRSGGMFDRGSWKFVKAAPKGGTKVRAWDLAGTEEAAGRKTRAAYTVGLLMKQVEGGYYIEDVERFRGGPKDVRRKMKSIAEQDDPDTIIDFPQDPGQAGKDQAQSLAQMLAGHNVRYSPETGAKETRAEPFSAQVEAGNVYLVTGPEDRPRPAWIQTFIDEAAFFPNSEYMDQIDAASRGFARLTKRKATPKVGQYSMR